MGSMLKGRGVGAPSSMHCMKRPSRQPSAMIQSAVDVAAVIRITVIKQHVKAITWNGVGIRHGQSMHRYWSESPGREFYPSAVSFNMLISETFESHGNPMFYTG